MICTRSRLPALLIILLAVGFSPAFGQHPGEWTGTIGGVGPDYTISVSHEDAAPFAGSYTVTATNTGTESWGDFHFGIFDPIGGQDISNVSFLDLSMDGEDPTSSQSGLYWVIDNESIGATIDLYYCSDPVLPGETVWFTVYTHNPDQLSFFGVLFYPTPVPPLGACCDPDGNCTLVCEYDCLPPSVWHEGWTCTPNPCLPVPTEGETWGEVKTRFQ